MVVKVMDEIREPTTPSKAGNQGFIHDANPVQLDHCYAKPWNWRQEMAHCKPVRTLFAEESSLTSSDELIDVEDVPPVKNVKLISRDATDVNFFDAEQNLSLVATEDSAMDWEETVKRDGWTPLQHRIFNKVVKLLIADNMSRLATAKAENEAVQKKILIEGSSKKMRIILSSVAWDMKITQWLHLTLIEHLSRDYLLCYISILQVLRNKVPTLVDRILNIPLTNTKLLGLNTQIMNYVHNKPWEPVLAPNTRGITKLPVAPVIVMVPSGTNNSFLSSGHGSKRYQTWYSLLQALGKVVTVTLPSTPAPHSLPLPTFVELIINTTSHKVQESRSLFPGRPIVLVGIQQGALIAAQVAHMEPVTALICLGFPLFCVDGKRGEADDFLLDLKSPTMFVVGQSSSNCTVDGMEQLRHRMKAESYLVVVEGAMDSLRMLKWKKKLQNLTQPMVDSSILDEISTFLTNVLLQASGANSGKRSPVDRKPESNSIGAGPSKRPRHSIDPEDGNHAALSGHNYSQNTPFPPPWKGRTGSGLARVRGGRIGPSQNRTQYHRTQTENSPSSGKVRIGRALSAGTYRLQGGTSESSTPVKTKLQRQQSTGPLEVDCDGKSSADSSQSSPKDELGSSVISESRGGDSSETESAPPAEDDDEIMEDLRLEDLRFCNELMSKQNSTPQKRVEDNPDDEFILRFSGDEVDGCRRLSAENRSQAKAAASPE